MRIMGHAKEWRDRRLDNDIIRLGFYSYKDACRVEHQEEISGILHSQWIRSDLLGMLMKWDDNHLVLIIPMEALERVKEELVAFEIDFTVFQPNKEASDEK